MSNDNLSIAPLPSGLSLQDLERELNVVATPLMDAEVVPNIAMLAASPQADDIREYVVTCHTMFECDSLVYDMQSYTSNRTTTIPNRRVDIAHLRPVSRNTHFWMTAREAVELAKDPRVAAVDLAIHEKGLIKVPFGVLYDDMNVNYTKAGSVTSDASYRNWALLRCKERDHRPGWGVGGNTVVANSQVRYDTGKHVDVIITDLHHNPNHPEFAWNEDGTGGSRSVQYNWFELNPAVKGTSVGTYSYNYAYGDHGTHVAGTACGNRQGWAREANIYQFDPFSDTNPNGTAATDYIFDYIQAFHKNKPINSATNRRNPTVINMSWGLVSSYLDCNWINTIVRQGGSVSAPTANTLTYLVFMAEQVGFTSAYANSLSYSSFRAPQRDAAMDADVEDMVANGVIAVGAAGNYYGMIDVPGGASYNNYVSMQAGAPVGGGSTIYTRRGGSPTASPSVIVVGNLGTQQISNTTPKANTTSGQYESKSQSSECGARIDIWAPGENILSAAPTAADGVADPRNSSYGMMMMTGTSMASPQVTGVMACLLSQYPDYTPTQCKAWLTAHSTSNQLANTDAWGGTPWGTPTNYPFGWITDLQGAPNRTLYVSGFKPLSGVAKPLPHGEPRPTEGAVWPRPNRTHRAT